MTVFLGSVTIALNTPGIFNSCPTEGKGLIISNASPFSIAISLQGSASGGQLNPGTADFFQIARGFNGNVTYSPTLGVSNPSSYTNYNLAFEYVGTGEQLSQGYPTPIPLTAVTPTASGKPLFTATFGVNSSAGIVQTLNVFNPSGSGVIATFHAAQTFTNSATGATSSRLRYLNGANLALGTAVTPASHDGKASPPVSKMVCTADDSGNSYQGTLIEQYNTAQNINVDLLTFPDNFTLEPGGNLHLDCIDGANGKLIRIILKYSEG